MHWVNKRHNTKKQCKEARRNPMQQSFFDYAITKMGGKRTDAFLTQMKSIMPFDEIEKKLIEGGIYKPNEGERGDLL